MHHVIRLPIPRHLPAALPPRTRQSACEPVLQTESERGAPLLNSYANPKPAELVDRTGGENESDEAASGP